MMNPVVPASSSAAFRMRFGLLIAGLLLLGLLPAGLQPVRAQERVPREVRTFVPPDQLVSFLPTTTFDQFVGYLNPLFQRVIGKQVVDPENRDQPIGLAITSMHFFDAFELVLDLHGLTYRETDRFFLVETPPEEPPTPVVQPTGTLALPPQPEPEEEAVATPRTREIRINAVIFQVDMDRIRQLGVDWNSIFGDQQQEQQQPGGQQQERPRFFLRTDRYFNRIDDFLVAPDRIDVAVLTQLFRLLEESGAGETIANPSVAVQSGEQGRIQIGSDLPVTVRDFAGNTITQFIPTGIIVNVVPTLIEDAPVDTAAGSPTMDFVHLEVQVERSSGRPFGSGIAIDRNTSTTKVLLLDGEQTIIGGLYSTEESNTRRGIPILKDLPPWFFGLRYLFGFDRTVVSQFEMLIVLQANVLDPLPLRAARPLPSEMLDEFRRRVDDVIQRFDRQARQR